MTGTFILSLDCEGKWGVSHNIDELHQRALTDNAITTAYEQLTAMLGRYEIPATFAFVMGFLIPRDEFASLARPDDPWLTPYRDALRAGHSQGWHVPVALDIVQSAGRHEVACHGFCHRPFEGVDRAAADEELKLAGQIAQAKGVRPDTFIYPYNRVAHIDLLKKHGFVGYRDRLKPRVGKLGKILTLADELNIWPRPQRGEYRNGIAAIPAGYFVNWRHGARAKIPAAVSVARMKNLVRRAARSGSVAHVWLHPHNLITGPSTAILLEAVLAEAARLRDRGEIRIETQKQYSDGLRG